MPKKKFIDKKKAVTFQLVHRSQQDPLVVDEDAPQRVLHALKPKETAEEKAARIEEQHKYGIYFADDTNYLEFLKERSDNSVQWPENIETEIEERKKRFDLPSVVFPSAKEEKVGMLNIAMPVSGPQLHLDADIVAAMDDDFDYDDPENELEDNFIELAEGAVLDQDNIDVNYQNYLLGDNLSEMEMDSDQGQWSESDRDEVDSLPESALFAKEETKSRCTNYSLSSSMMRRNEQLQLLDRRFDKMLEDYDDSEEDEDNEGLLPGDSEELLKYAEEFENSKQPLKLDRDDEIINITKEMATRKNAFKTEYIEVEVEKKISYDCQSILSTYSNIHNRPKIIEYVPLKPKKLTQRALNKLDPAKNESAVSEGSDSNSSARTRLTNLSIRDKNETLQEKKERKKALKEYRKGRREEKKMNKLAFATDLQRQKKIASANKGNLQCRNQYL